MFNKNVELDKYNSDTSKRYKTPHEEVRNRKKIRTIMNDMNVDENQEESLPDSSIANNFNELGNNLANQDLMQRGGS